MTGSVGVVVTAGWIQAAILWRLNPALTTGVIPGFEQQQSEPIALTCGKQNKSKTCHLHNLKICSKHGQDLVTTRCYAERGDVTVSSFRPSIRLSVYGLSRNVESFGIMKRVNGHDNCRSTEIKSGSCHPRSARTADNISMHICKISTQLFWIWYTLNVTHSKIIIIIIM